MSNETVVATPKGMGIPSVIAVGVLGAAAGSLGTIIVQRLLPEPKSGDGWNVRWLDKDGTEKRLSFGEDEKGALERAIALAAQYPGVEIVEIRQGLIKKVQQAGQPPKEVAPGVPS